MSHQPSRSRLEACSDGVIAVVIRIDGLGFTLLASVIIRHLKLADPAFAEHEAAAEAAMQTTVRWKGMVGMTMYLVAIPLSYGNDYLVLGDITLVTLISIVPTFGLKPPTHEGDGVD
jgi:hypothetical protein